MPAEGRPAVFLDRDGTLLEDRDYLADPALVSLLPGACEAVARLRAAGLPVVVVTNQSGIARGLYREDDYRAVAARMEVVLGASGAALDATYYCPHHPDFSGPCECRKPGPGMYRTAARDLGLSLARSYYVGDKLTDVAAAARFGGTAVLVRTGYGRDSERAAPAGVQVVDDLAGAADLILRQESRAERDDAPGAARTVSTPRGAVDPPETTG